MLVAAAVVSASLVLAGSGGPTRRGPGSSRPAPAPVGVPRQALQFRPSESAVRHPAGVRCSPPDVRRVPVASEATWVAWQGGCARVGPAVLSVRDVRSVTAGY